MSGNKFVLKSDQIEVEYTIGINPGLPALTYSDGVSGAVSFTSSEIATDETALGTLVSVALLRTIDTGAQRFGSSCPRSTSFRDNPSNSLRWECMKGSAGLTRFRTFRHRGAVSSCTARRNP